MKQEKSKKVFSCCGQLFACTNATKDIKHYCPRCNKELTTPIPNPNIIIIKQV